MKTAVEELIDFLEQNQYFIGNDLFQEFARVKELNKNQLEKAYDTKCFAFKEVLPDGGVVSEYIPFEQYYKKTFKSE